MEMSHTQNDSHPHIYINDTERNHQGLTQHHDYELVSYHKPNATQDKESTNKHTNFDGGKYHGTVPKQREKAQPGKDRVECQSNEKLQTVHNDFKSSLEETSCVDANADLELLSHEEDTQVYFNAQEYNN